MSDNAGLVKVAANVPVEPSNLAMLTGHDALRRAPTAPGTVHPFWKEMAAIESAAYEATRDRWITQREPFFRPARSRQRFADTMVGNKRKWKDRW